MATAIDNGFSIPEKNDKGNVWAPTLENNWQRTSTHSHDGNDSELLNSKNFIKDSQILLASNWISSGNGFKQTISAPTGISLDKVDIRFRVTAGVHQHKFINPSVNGISLTQFEVFLNDPTLEVEVLYI